MLKKLVLIGLLVLCCHAFPRYQRLRRAAEDGLKYGPCKNTYDQCPEWKGQGMCTSDQYKEYMMTVCPVTCEFCRDSKKKISRDYIEMPEEIAEENRMTETADENSESGSGASGDVTSGSPAADFSGSGSGNVEEETSKRVQIIQQIPGRKKSNTTLPITKGKIETKETSVKGKIAENTVHPAESGDSSGQSESEPEDEEEAVDEEGSARDEEAAPIQTTSKGLKTGKHGSISLVLRQNFQNTYTNHESPSYQMLSGNVKKDLEKVLKGSKVTDISFSEANIEGNPRQMGKTKVVFHLKNNDQNVMKTLTNLVDSGSINGLSVFGGSLEFDE